MKTNVLYRTLAAAATVLALTAGPLVLAAPAAASDAAPSVPGRTGTEKVWPSLPDHPAAAAYIKATESLDWWAEGSDEKFDALVYRLMHDHNLSSTSAYSCGSHGPFPTVAKCMANPDWDPMEDEVFEALALEARRATHTHKSIDPASGGIKLQSFRAPEVNEDLLYMPGEDDNSVGLKNTPDTWTVTLGRWTPGAKVTFQWFLDGKAIPGATKPFYNPRQSDEFHQLSVAVTGRKDGWHPHVETVGPYTVGSLFALQGGDNASISGSTKIGSTLKANPGTWPVGTTFTYQWNTTGGLPIKGATKPTYVTTAADAGQWISVKITAAKPGFIAGITYGLGHQVDTPAVASGTPTIIGTPKVGVRLTARPGPWTAGTELTYQWLANGKPVAGATAPTFTPGAAHSGTTISVWITGSKSAYSSVTTASKPTAKVALGSLTAPVPSISGTPKVGAKLTVKPGLWSTNTKLAYQWLSNGKPLSGATATTFTPGSAQRGTAITLKVTGTKAGYTTTSATSKATTKVATGTLTAPVPAITGTAKVGKTLTAKSGTWTAGTKLSYQWYANGKAVAKATKPTLKLAAGHRGTKITVKVTGAKAGYTTTSATSKATTKVATGTLTAPVPAITGTAKVGKTLTAKSGTWTAGTKLSYQWYANGKAVAKATKPTLKLAAGHRGTKITVKVTGAKAGHATAAKVSKATKAVTK